MLHHDNAPAHTSLICDILGKHEMTVIPQPPYSPDLNSAVFFFVSKVEIQYERSPISDNRRDRRNVLWGLCAILQNAFQNWK
jgi:transposase